MYRRCRLFQLHFGIHSIVCFPFISDVGWFFFHSVSIFFLSLFHSFAIIAVPFLFNFVHTIFINSEFFDFFSILHISHSQVLVLLFHFAYLLSLSHTHTTLFYTFTFIHMAFFFLHLLLSLSLYHSFNRSPYRFDLIHSLHFWFRYPERDTIYLATLNIFSMGNNVQMVEENPVVLCQTLSRLYRNGAKPFTVVTVLLHHCKPSSYSYCPFANLNVFLPVFSHLQLCHLSYTAKICSILNNNNNNNNNHDKSVIFNIFRNISCSVWMWERNKKEKTFTNHRRQFYRGIYSYITHSHFVVCNFFFFCFFNVSLVYLFFFRLFLIHILILCVMILLFYWRIECTSRTATIGTKFCSVFMTATAKRFYALWTLLAESYWEHSSPSCTMYM